MGYIQTWLLYQNALSKGIEIDDILQFARHTKENARSETENVHELKAKLASQEKKIQELLEMTALHSNQNGSSNHGQSGKSLLQPIASISQVSLQQQSSHVGSTASTPLPDGLPQVRYNRIVFLPESQMF